METFSYEAINFAGETINGEMEAANSEAVLDHLHRLGFVPLAASRKTSHWASRLKQTKFSSSQKLSLNDVSFLTQELSVLLRAGLPMERAISVLASLVDKPHLTNFLDKTLDKMRSGNSFSGALEAYKSELPHGYIGMMHAGEAGGAKALDATMERLAEYLKRLQKIREDVFSAMLYPAIVLVMAILSVLIILLFVLPQFEPLFQSAPRGALPVSTQIILGIAHGLRDYGLLVLIAIIGAGFAIRALLRREHFQLKRDKFFLRLPQIGQIIVKSEMARFCNMLGVLLVNGVPPVTALSISAESFSNQVFASAAQRVITRVREGDTLFAPMQKETVFPSLSLQMIRIGEETGHLDQVLLNTADIYDRDLQRSIARLMTLITPLTTIILGIIIATIIAAILSAILSINDLVT